MKRPVGTPLPLVGAGLIVYGLLTGHPMKYFAQPVAAKN